MSLVVMSHTLITSMVVSSYFDNSDTAVFTFHKQLFHRIFVTAIISTESLYARSFGSKCEKYCHVHSEITINIYLFSPKFKRDITI